MRAALAKTELVEKQMRVIVTKKISFIFKISSSFTIYLREYPFVDMELIYSFHQR